MGVDVHGGTVNGETFVRIVVTVPVVVEIPLRGHRVRLVHWAGHAGAISVLEVAVAHAHVVFAADACWEEKGKKVGEKNKLDAAAKTRRGERKIAVVEGAGVSQWRVYHGGGGKRWGEGEYIGRRRKKIRRGGKKIAVVEGERA